MSKESSVIPGDFIIPSSGKPYTVFDYYPPNLNPRSLEKVGPRDFIVPLSHTKDLYYWAKDTSIMKILTSHQFDVLYQRFEEGFSQAAVAQRCGVTREAVRNTEAAALHKIGDYIDWRLRT